MSMIQHVATQRILNYLIRFSGFKKKSSYFPRIKKKGKYSPKFYNKIADLFHNSIQKSSQHFLIKKEMQR